LGGENGSGADRAETHTPVVRSSMIGRGHDACSVDPYVAGYKPASNPGWSHPVAYYPNQAGMDRLAAAIEATLGRDGAPQ
jgi:hypothetical protein